MTLLPDRCHPGWTKGWEQLLGGGTCKAKPRVQGGGVCAPHRGITPPPLHLFSCRIATNAARKLQEERGKGQWGSVGPMQCCVIPPPQALHAPASILGSTEELGSPIALCSSIRLGPCGRDKGLSPSSLAG